MGGKFASPEFFIRGAQSANSGVSRVGALAADSHNNSAGNADSSSMSFRSVGTTAISGVASFWIGPLLGICIHLSYGGTESLAAGRNVSVDGGLASANSAYSSGTTVNGASTMGSGFIDVSN